MRNIDTKIDNTAPAGTGRLPAAQFNALADEVENVATSAGLTLDPAAGPDTDLEQVAQAIARYASAAVFGTDSGAANTYVVAKLGSYVVPKSLFNGLRVLFYPAHSNSGAATVNVFGLGVKPLVDHAGAALASGAIIANRLIEAVYDAGNSVFKLAPWANALLFSGGGGGGGGGVSGITSPWDLIIEDQRSSGVACDAATNTWSRLTLNTIIHNALGATLSGSAISGLAAGTYLVEWRSMGANTGKFRSRLRNLTTSSTVGLSSTGYSNTTEESNNDVMGLAKITLVAEQSIALEAIAEIATGDTETCNWGWHGPSGWSVVETYTQIRMQKIG